jgi:hypothetical protein
VYRIFSNSITSLTLPSGLRKGKGFRVYLNEMASCNETGHISRNSLPVHGTATQGCSQSVLFLHDDSDRRPPSRQQRPLIEIQSDSFRLFFRARFRAKASFTRFFSPGLR